MIFQTLNRAKNKTKKFIIKYYKEILVFTAWLIGWMLATWALYDILQDMWIVKLSAGFFLLGLVGYKFIFRIIINGLYILSQD